jgi:hypothetical protein
MTLCEYCKKDINITFICSICGGRYCKHHRKPEIHKCKSIKIESNENIIENMEIKEAIESISDTDSEHSLIPRSNTNESGSEKIIKDEGLDMLAKESHERVYKPYKDFTYMKSRTKRHHQSSNWLIISKTLGKWVIVTGSFYLILYSLFKLLSFITTFKI